MDIIHKQIRLYKELIISGFNIFDLEKKIMPNFAQSNDLFCFPEAGRKSQKVFPGV